MPENTEPILTFYYNSREFVETTIVTEGLKTEVQRFTAYSDIERTKLLGYISYNSIKSTVDGILIISGTGTLVFIENLNDDSFTFANAGISFPSNLYPPNVLRINPIVLGRGKYQFLTFTGGFVAINTFENGDRICYLYTK